MLERMIGRSWPVLAVLLGGCHILFPYSPGANDGSREQRVGDAWREGLWREGLLPDRRLVDLPRSEAGCPIERLDAKLAGCAGGCGDAGNPDCDGLPTGRDYYGVCNQLVFEDHFDTAPVSTSWFNPPAAPGSWSWSCGWYHQSWAGGTYEDPLKMAWARSVSAEVPLAKNGADYLVEARVRLGSIGNQDLWGVGIVARYNYTVPFANIVCELRVDKINGGKEPLLYTPAVTLPDVRIETRASATEWGAGWPETRNSPAKGDEGRIYYLQLWYTKHAVSDPKYSYQCIPSNTCYAVACRVCEESQCVREGIYAFWINQVDPADPDMSLLPTAPGSVGLRTYGRAASFDYIRVFQLTNP
jgi:hypothetical protein